jgi:quercetin dioxygenase-like cupin family protein
LDHPISTPQELSSLVDYQPDSVVSRVVFRGPGGTMTVFAFAGGQGLSEHTNPNDAFVHVLAGEVSILIAGAKHRVVEGEMLHLPPSVPHELVGDAPFKMLLTLLKRHRATE